MVSDAGDVDRLHAAIETHERFIAEHGRCSASEFLAAHEDLRDLLEPLLAPAPTALQPNAASTRVLGDFRLLGEIGRGGMGIVYDAEQISLGRRVAVKVLPGHFALDPDRRARFAREARLAASLDHPGIAKVISAGIDDELIWFAMERIDGAPLDRVLSRAAATRVASMSGHQLEEVVLEVARHHGVAGGGSNVPTAEPGKDAIRAESTVWRTGHVDTVVRIGIQVAEALHHAHQHGVVHRDVKPANIVLRRDGHAMLTDFGLARELNAPSLTLTGDFLGTPSYCAPEQFSDNRAAVDHRVDVFALGVTLYELLTHRRPFEASTTDELRVRILTVEPLQPRRLNPKIASNLSSVLLKALEKDPNRRYQSAAAMANDLRAFAEGRPVRAQPIRAHVRTWRWCRRNPWIATTLTLMLGVVLLLLAMRAQLVRANVEQTITAGLALARAGDFRGALAELMPIEQRSHDDAATRAALHELFRRYPCLAAQPLVSKPNERVSTAQFSADGQRFLTTHEWQPEAGPMSWHVRLWMAPTPDSSIAASLWRSDECRETPTSTLVDSGKTVVWASRGAQTVFVGGPDRVTSEIRFAEPVIQLFRASVPGHFGVALESVAQCCDTDGRVARQWPHRQAREPYTPTILSDVLVWSRLVAARHALVYAAPGAEPVEIVSDVRGPLIALDPVDPARMVVVTSTSITAWSCERGTLRSVDVRENPLPDWLSFCSLGVNALELVAAEPHLGRLGELPLRGSDLRIARVFGAKAGGWRERYVVAIDDQVLRIWLMPEPQQPTPTKGGLEIAHFEPAGRIGSTARRLWSAGEMTWAAWSFDAHGVDSHVDVAIPAQLRDAVVGQLKPSFCGIAFDPGLAILACARGQRGPNAPPGWIFVLAADDLRVTDSQLCGAEPNHVELSPDGRQLAVAESDGRVELWTYDSASRALTDRVVLKALANDATRLSCVRYIGKRFLLAAEGMVRGRGGILRWDLDASDAQPVSIAPAAVRSPLRCLAVSPDQGLVATGGDDRFVRVMRVVWRDGKPTLAAAWHKEHGAAVFAVAFAERDGAMLLASADRHGGIQLWDAETGHERGIVRAPAANEDEMILSLAFSPDFRHLAASQRGGRVLLWDMDRPQRCLEGNRECAERVLRLQADSRGSR